MLNNIGDTVQYPEGKFVKSTIKNAKRRFFSRRMERNDGPLTEESTISKIGKNSLLKERSFK